MHKIAAAILVSSVLALNSQAGMAASSHSNSVAPRGELKGLAPCLSWVEPGHKPWLALLCVHGLGLYNGSWEAFGERLSPYGIAVYAIDVRGFGSWMKANGHEQINFQACLHDVQEVLKSIRMANPNTPVYIMGESMGGAIALQATALYPHLIDGLISVVPAGDRFKQKRTDLKVALHFLDGYNKQFDIGKQIVQQATTDPSLRKAWETDPLSRMNLSPKELIQFQDFMNKNHDRAKEITKTPVIIFQGSLDKLVKPEGTIELFNELKTPDKTLEMVPNGEHLIFEEDQFDEHDIDVLTAWLDKHAKRASVPDLQSNNPTMVPPSFNAKPEPGASVKRIPLRPQLSPAQGILRQDAMAHARLADASMRLHDLESARYHYRFAMLESKGSALAKQINTKLLSMPIESVAPKVGDDTRVLAEKLGINSGNLAAAKTKIAVKTANAGKNPELGSQFVATLLNKASNSSTNFKHKAFRAPHTSGGINSSILSVSHTAKPTVIYFFADWCEPCQQLDEAMDRAKTTFTNEINFVGIDIDDPSNHELIVQYGVSPIPTVLFLDSSGKVVSYTIGYNGDETIMTEIHKLLPLPDSGT